MEIWNWTIEGVRNRDLLIDESKGFLIYANKLNINLQTLEEKKTAHTQKQTAEAKISALKNHLKNS